jgi:hypothetical protein
MGNLRSACSHLRRDFRDIQLVVNWILCIHDFHLATVETFAGRRSSGAEKEYWLLLQFGHSHNMGWFLIMERGGFSGIPTLPSFGFSLKYPMVIVNQWRLSEM